ncbi:hypothetical protein Leryth_024906 [Lithospermum erythrorhizon]|nr:hypothetical protein Leryth_024906 [Lithospermum erythrorhizon]
MGIFFMFLISIFSPFLYGGFNVFFLLIFSRFIDVKITRFRDMVEARTVVCSSLKRLVHVHEIRKSGKGANDLVGTCHGGVATKDKLLKVIEWVHRAGLIHCSDDLNPERRLLLINWKQQAEAQVKDYSSLIELCHLPDSCETIFYASVGEIFLPITWRCVKDSEVEEMFISRRLDMYQDDHLVDDFISPGCQQCDIPLNSDYGLSIEQKMFPLYCQKSSNCQHKVGMIYRPFMLYVWDESKYIPLLVMNKAAELLFGNISAEKVYSCYQAQKQRDKPDRKVIHGPSHCFKEAASGLGASQTTGKGKHPDRNINFYLIWLFLLKTLLLQGKNDPLKLKISINLDKDIESGRYEMMSVSMPVFGSSKSSANPA